MSDAYSNMSNEDLLRIYQGNAPAPAPSGDYSNMSNEQLLRIYQGTATTGQSQPEMQGPPDERPFMQWFPSKVQNFFRNVRENPPPFWGGIAQDIYQLPQHARTLGQTAMGDIESLTPEEREAAAQEAGGVLRGAAALTPATPGLRAGEGILGAPLGTAETRSGAAAIAAPAAAAAPTESTAAIEAGGRIGVNVPRYLATEGTAMPQFAAGIKNIPWGGEPIVTSAQELLTNLGAAKTAQATTPATSDIAGQAARQGIVGYVKGGSQGPIKSAYDAVDALVNPEFRAPLQATRAMVGEIMAERMAARAPESKAANLVMDAVRDPLGMDYSGTKLLRTLVGEKTPQQMVAEGISPAEHKRIYNALTTDLGNIIRGSGGDAAFGAWHEANVLARQTAMRRTLLGKVIGVAGDASPEAVFSRLMNYAGSRSSADIARLRLAKSAMGPDAWSQVTDALINRMGMDPGGRFSADRFVTAYGNLAPAARAELFTTEQRAALDDLFLVSRHIQDRITRLANPSGTGRTLFAGGAIGGLVAEPVTAISSMIGTRLAARYMSQPAVVRAVRDVNVAQLRNNALATQRAIDRLRNLLTVGARVESQNLQ